LFDREVEELGARIPAGPRLGIIGSTALWHPESEATCIALGVALAGLDGVLLLTGGVEGIGETVGRSFHAARTQHSHDSCVFHVLPRGSRQWDYGETLFAGSNMSERREILGRLADVYVEIEGGPGTAHEASVALARPVPVIPVGRSGGHAGELYLRMTRPSFAAEEAWQTLGGTDKSQEVVAQALTDIIRMYLDRPRGTLPTPSAPVP
jgi:hypothetical protein